MRAPRRAGAIAPTTPTTASTAIRPSCPGGTLKLTSHSDSARVVSQAKAIPTTVPEQPSDHGRDHALVDTGFGSDERKGSSWSDGHK